MAIGKPPCTRTKLTYCHKTATIASLPGSPVGMLPRFFRSQSSISSPPSPPTTATPPDPAYRPSVSDNDEERNLTNRIRFFTTDRLRRHPSVNMSLNFVGSPDFQAPPAQPAQARHSSHPRRSRATSLAGSVDQRLSVIDEDHPSPPLDSPTPINPKTQHRPFSRRFGLGEPPKYSSSNRPPNYTFWDITGPKGEKFDDLRNNAYIAKRGGWRRFCIIFWLILVVAIALAVGLGVGLSRRHHNEYALSTSMQPSHNTNSIPTSSKPAPSPSASSSPQTGPFPAGSYTFTTFLSTVSTNCTSNPSSWNCQPSVTYSTDPSGSEAQFNWIISTTNSTPISSPNFTISSTNNPFSIDFTNTSLILMDAGQDTERYSFTTTVPKIVYPTTSLSIKCFYNQTQFSGNLYTKKPKTAPSGAAAASSTSTASAAASTGDAFAEWNFAVEATQSIGGGVDVPDCYQYNNGQTGARVTQGYEERDAGQFCSCAYKNDNP